MLNEYFNRKKCEDHLPHQALEASGLIQNLLDKPENFDEHLNRYQFLASSLPLTNIIITRFSTAVILRIDHGHDIISDDDPYLKIMSDVTYSVTHCAAPMSNIVDLLPISCVILHSHFSYPNQTKPNLTVKYLPSWFPGTYAATQARSFRPFVDLMHDYPFEDVKKQLVRSPQALSSIITLH